MIKIVHVVVFVIWCSISSNAQIYWPPVTQQTKPWTRWWWQGSEVNKKDLSLLMQQYQQSGLGGLEITPIYGVQGEEDQYIPFLSSKWMEVFSHTLKEGKRLDLGLDLANATGWPFGGPWIGDEDACKNMHCKTYVLHPGESLHEPIQYIQEPFLRTANNNKSLTVAEVLQPISENKNLQSLSLDQIRFKRPLPLQVLMAYSETGAHLDLTNTVDALGKLNWLAPLNGGSWTLYALFMGWHGKQVERAAPGGEGNVIDHFSSKALHHYLSHFDQAFKGHDISNLRGFFNDSYEVDDAVGQSNYTPDLFNEFKKRRGYDLRYELPSLFATSPNEKTNRILCDYRMTIDELILDQFTGAWTTWAHSKGKIVRNQSHGSPANTLDLYGVVDIPETEGTEILRIKFAPSTSHVLGKPLAAAESATWLNEHFISSLSDIKKALDLYFIGGVNHIIYHGTAYSPPSEPWPGRLFYASVELVPANPFWNDITALNEYVTRTQSFLQQGKPSNDILLYFPIYDKYSEPAKDLLLHFDGMKPDFNGTAFETTAQSMYDHGYAFDYISDRQILHLQTFNKKIITGGTAYQTIILPDCKYLKLETIQKLVALACQGATILVYKNLPGNVPGYGDLEKNRTAFDKVIGQFHFTATEGEIRAAVLGKGRILIGDNLEELLRSAAIRKESMVDQGLQFSRRKQSDGSEFYFIANRSNKKVEAWVPLHTRGNTAVLYNPMTGQSGISQFRKNSNGFIEVYLQLNIDESVLVQTASKSVHGARYPYVHLKGEPQEIHGPWTLSFNDGGPSLPMSAPLNELYMWTSLEGDMYKSFSGSASYRASFKRPAENASQYILNLGQVAESAQVFMNGKKMATLIGPEYALTISAKDLKEDNLLEIHISNSMANRIIDLDRKNILWKKFNNTNFPAKFKENRGQDGLFNASSWKPRVSGLAGPVTLTSIQ